MEKKEYWKYESDCLSCVFRAQPNSMIEKLLQNKWGSAYYLLGPLSEDCISWVCCEPVIPWGIYWLLSLSLNYSLSSLQESGFLRDQNCHYLEIHHLQLSNVCYFILAPSIDKDALWFCLLTNSDSSHIPVCLSSPPPNPNSVIVSANVIQLSVLRREALSCISRFW